MLDSGKVALVTDLIPTSERIGEYIWPNHPYSTDQYALISLSEFEDISLTQLLKYRVGVLKNSAFENVFRSWFPQYTELEMFTSADDAFEALEKGKIDLVMSSRNQMLSMMHYFEKPFFKTNLIFERNFLSTFGLNVNEDMKTAEEYIEKMKNIL